MRRFGVLWMDRDAIAPAFELDGAFDDVVVRLEPGASDAAVIESLDRILEPYGGLGAVTRKTQPSALHVVARARSAPRARDARADHLPRVAAFLVNVVLSRVVGLQRGRSRRSRRSATRTARSAFTSASSSP